METAVAAGGGERRKDGTMVEGTMGMDIDDDDDDDDVSEYLICAECGSAEKEVWCSIDVD